jgi:hypothetical protein
MPIVKNKPDDHRTRVAPYSRVNLPAPRVGCPVAVFARDGARGCVIDELVATGEVVTTAEILPGTADRDVRTIGEMRVAVAAKGGNPPLRIVDPVVRETLRPVAARRLALPGCTARPCGRP